ncbi:MAG: hypothetical protein SGILL_005946 [Bacillariaceae sp.]
MEHPTVFFELSVMNADKPAIDPMMVAERVEKFLNLPNMPQSWGVMLTSAPLFAEKLHDLKACIVDKHPEVNFVIGTDTLVRIINPKYYGSSERKMLDALKAMAGAHFFVGGRLEQSVKTGNPRFVSGQEELNRVPGTWAAQMFTIMKEPEFRIDVSSSEIRRKQQGTS